jgi:hypothetical protein
MHCNDITPCVAVNIHTLTQIGSPTPTQGTATRKATETAAAEPPRVVFLQNGAGRTQAMLPTLLAYRTPNQD